MFLKHQLEERSPSLCSFKASLLNVKKQVQGNKSSEYFPSLAIYRSSFKLLISRKKYNIARALFYIKVHPALKYQATWTSSS